jgi:hypothetical protein
MKTVYKIGLIVLLVSAITFLIISIEGEEKPFNKVEISRNSIVTNGTDKTYYDTIFQVGLNLLGIQGLDILVRPLSDNAKSQFEGELKAHVIEYPNGYYVFIDDVSRQESIDIIAHEIIHIQQYFSNDLQVINESLLWKNEKFEINGLPYDSRPWEVEAFDRGKMLAREIEGVLYNK